MLNKIMLIGNLGKEPDMTYLSSGKPLTKFTLAVNRRMRDRETNETREETQWFNIVAWDRLAETCSQYLHKGSKVYIEGRISSRKYNDRDGVERTAWEVTATEMQMLDPKGASGQQQSSGMPDEMGADDVPF